MRSILCLLSLLFAHVAAALGPFVEVGASVGIQSYEQAPPMGSGVAAADIDGDGDTDWFVPNREGKADQLYLNLGGGQLAEVAALRGLASMARSRAAVWLDIEGDGDLDLVVGGDCFGQWVLEPGQTQCLGAHPLQRLYRNDAGQFVDVTLGSGLEQDSSQFQNDEHRGGYAAADIDQDGDLDLYSSMWFGQSRLYLNDGSGHYSDATASYGTATATQLAQWQPVFADFDRDGHIDLFVAVDFAANLLFHNDGHGHFNELATGASVATIWNEMGVALGDYDNDRDPDVYATNVWQREPGEHNVLFRNDSTPGQLQFTDVAMSLGVGNTSWGWGTTFFDADLDGDLDLAATNGFGSSDGPQYLNDPTCLFRNDGVAFVELAAAAGVADTYWGSALLAFDYDLDGRIDLLQTSKAHPAPGPLRLMRNEHPGTGNFLRVLPRMRSGNTQAIGAVVEARVGSSVWTRYVTAGISFLGQEPAEAHFGIGAATRVDELRVRWPDGRETRRFGVAANVSLRVDDDEIWVDSFE